jgi:hypothetical protein
LLGESGQYARAAREFKREIELREQPARAATKVDGLWWHYIALLYVAGGDLESYRNTYETMLKKFGDAGNKDLHFLRKCF